MIIKVKCYILPLLGCLLMNSAYCQTNAELDKKRIMLPNGWSITPVGKNIPLGDLPLNLAVSNNKKYMAVTNNGQSTHTIDLIDVAKGVRIDSIVIAKAWYGLAFSKTDQFLYASGGNDNQVNRYAIVQNKLQLADSFVLGKAWPVQIGTAGLDVEETLHNKLFVVTKEAKSLFVFDLKTKQQVNKIDLGAEAYTCNVSTDKKSLYISLWGDKKILVYDIAAAKIGGQIEVGDHPNEMILTRNGAFLYVANSQDNSVSVISTKTNAVVETLNAALYPSSPSGSTSNGIALSEDEKTLYIANADNNCLAVFDVSVTSKSKSKGFIPVGWYPTNVKVVGNKIYVANGKGLTSYANPFGPNPVNKKQVVLSHLGEVQGLQQYSISGPCFVAH